MNNIYISITEARKNLFDISQKASKTGKVFRLTQNGTPSVAMISSDELDSLYETLEIMTENPNIKDELKKAQLEYKKGGFVDWDDIKLDYGIQNTSSKKRSKRVK